MKVSRRKTEYMCVNKMESSGKVKLQGARILKVDEFKYLGSIPPKATDSEVEKRVKARGGGWRQVSGFFCERRIAARVKR